MRIVYQAVAMAFVFMVLATAASGAESARFALLIANQGYAGAVGPLNNPRNDIALIKASLLKIGFTEASIKVISDADRVAMLKAFDDFAAEVARAGSDAISFFYYSGHGAANERRENYLIPVDVSELYASGFWYRSVALRDLLDRLNAEAPDAKHFVIFDACRNTLILKETGGKGLSEPKGFQPVLNIPGGMLIAFSTAEGELASDQGEGAGPYSKALAEEIVKPGVGAVTVFRNAQLRVSESIGQKPWTQNGPMAAVYFAGRIPSPSEAIAEQTWEQIKGLKDPEVFRNFREKYGSANPVYDYLAKQRLEEIINPLNVKVSAFYDALIAREISDAKLPYLFMEERKPDSGALQIRNLYRSAFEKGLAEAGLELGRLFRTGFPINQGSDAIQRDPEAAIDLFYKTIDKTKEVDQDFLAPRRGQIAALAAFELISMYDKGEAKRPDGTPILTEDQVFFLRKDFASELKKISTPSADRRKRAQGEK